MRLSTLLLCCAFALALATAPAAASEPRDVIYVGNNWDGTSTVADAETFKPIARINIIPDKEERLAEIRSSPDREAYFLGIRHAVGEGNDQFVDDMYSSRDGRFLYVSRPSFADVIGMDLRTRKIVWRTPVEGYRADHMGISPDGRRLLVSASTAKKVHEIDTATGRIVGGFPSGDQPHENTYSLDGKTVFHASIGSVFTPTDEPALDRTKGERVFLVVDTESKRILKRLDMGQKLAEAGYPNMSAAVRPMALSPDERFVYFQVSFFHGFVEYDLQQDKVLRIAELPISQEAASKRREEYLLDSAHHGLAMNPEGTKLCVAGTMSDYAAIVARSDFRTTIAAKGGKPYWSTNSFDGKHCLVSFSSDDRVAVVDYATEREVASIPVGRHPQRVRTGKLAQGALGVPAQPSGGSSSRGGATRPALRVSVTPRRVSALRPVTMRVRVTVRRNGRVAAVPGARVKLAGVTARTDRRGRAKLRKRFGFERVRSYRATATRPGFRSGRATVRSVRR